MKKFKTVLALLLLMTAISPLWAGGKAKPGTVTHLVVCWLKKPGDGEARRKVVEATRTFRKIPGVLSVGAGRMLPDARPVVDSTFDLAIVMILKDEAALRGYLSHPIHLKAVEEVIKPNVKKFVVYDIVNE